MQKILALFLISLLFLAQGCARKIQVGKVAIGGNREAALVLKTSNDEYIRKMALSSDGKRIAVLNSENKLKLWDAEKGGLVFSLVHRGSIHTMAFVPGSKLLAVAGATGGKVSFYDTNSTSVVRTIENAVKKKETQCCLGGGSSSPDIDSISFSADGKLMATGGSDGVARIWDYDTGLPLKTIKWHEPQNIITSAILSGDGSLIALAGGETHYRTETRVGTRSVCASYDSKGNCTGYRTETYTYTVVVTWYKPIAKVIKVQNDEVLVSFRRENEGLVLQAALCPNNRYCAFAGKGLAASLWEIQKGSLLRELPDSLYADCLAFDPSGASLLMASREHTIQSWDIGSGNLVKKFFGHYAHVSDIRFSPDKKTIISGGDTTIRLWDTGDGRQKGLLASFGNDWVVTSSQGKYDGSPNGIKNLEWNVNKETISLEDFGSSFSEKKLLARLLNYEKIAEKSDTSFDIVTHLIGKVYQVQGGQVIVASGRASELMKMGEKVFVVIEGNKILLEVKFPMMTTARCTLQANDPALFAKIRPGMPVFK